MWRYDIVEDQQVRRHHIKKSKLIQLKDIYLDCLCLFFDILFELVPMSNRYVDI